MHDRDAVPEPQAGIPAAQGGDEVGRAGPELYIGLMSGTSLDGVDGVLACFSAGADGTLQANVLAEASQPYPESLRAAFMALQAPSENELHHEALAGNALARLYAACVRELLCRSGLTADSVRAIGAHGQTIRHQPGLYDGVGYTRQTLNGALLAELTGIAVIADLRSRDLAAGGQGAPLVPAFHGALFGHPAESRVICNIGGIANITVLRAARPGPEAAGTISGFDCGPGNALLDYWTVRHLGQHYDDDGAWAAGGTVVTALLDVLLGEPYFSLPPPKSTGRDLFNPAWLSQRLGNFANLDPRDVQSTLTEFTARTIADSIRRHAPDASRLLVCGGGARNAWLMRRLGELLTPLPVDSTGSVGVPVMQVEALAFAWLAECFCQHRAGNLPAATGAAGPRILGALHSR